VSGQARLADIGGSSRIEFRNDDIEIPYATMYARNKISLPFYDGDAILRDNYDKCASAGLGSRRRALAPAHSTRGCTA